MKQEDRELLLRDLCARLPYDVKISKVIDNFISDPHQIRSINLNNIIVEDGEFEDGTPDIDIWDYENIKPYLFPLSSMTEEQRSEYENLLKPSVYKSLEEEDVVFPTLTSANPSVVEIDYFNKYHFDYRGLISMGLAIDATGLNIY